MNGIRTITLDLDDTLWDLPPVIRRAEKRLHEWLDENYPRITAKFDADAMKAVRKRVVEECAEKAHHLTFLRQAVLLHMATAAGYDHFRVDDAFAVFDEERNAVDVFPETRPALLALRKKFTLVALTNGNANLEMIGVDDLFDAHINAEMAGAAKPHRPIFDAAVRAGGAEAHETVHVGDSPKYDVHGAHEAGLRTVWVNRNGDSWPNEYAAPDAEVTHVGELEALFACAR